MKAVAPRSPRACAQLVGVVVTVAGIVVLAGRAFDISSLESVLAGWPKMMVPATALGFVVFGAALWRLAQNVDYMVDWNTSLEMLGFQGTAWTTNPSTMAPATALCFFLLGVALLLAGTRKFASVFQAVTILAGIVASRPMAQKQRPCDRHRGKPRGGQSHA